MNGMLRHNNRSPSFRGLSLSETVENPKFQHKTSSYSDHFSSIFALMANSTVNESTQGLEFQYAWASPLTHSNFRYLVAFFVEYLYISPYPGRRLKEFVFAM